MVPKGCFTLESNDGKVALTEVLFTKVMELLSKKINETIIFISNINSKIT